MRKHPMISSRVLTNMPELILSEVGAKGLAKAFSESGLNEEVVGETHHFILQSSLSRFVNSAARQLGDEKLGLILAPHLTIRDYGIYGEYVLSGVTLREALQKNSNTIRYHGSHDILLIATGNGFVKYQYKFASSHLPGYENLAYCAVGVLLSIVREYLGSSWKPEFIELDIPKSGRPDLIEEGLGAKVKFGAPCVSLVFHETELARPRLAAHKNPLIVSTDVLRRRRDAAPDSTIGIVREMIGTQILDGDVGINKVANELGFSIRTLQRVLDAEGTNFREMTKAKIIERSMALISETDYSIGEISVELGYSHAAHFTRAFKKASGITPIQYRKIATAAE